MLSLLVVSTALLGLDPAVPSNTAVGEERDSYEAALAQVGRDADAHVRLALWCEAHGLDAERIKHLSLAVLNNPAHPLARGLLGLVSYRGRWQRPEAVGAAVQADAARKALVAQYEERRDRLPETAEAHWRLALWCEENGLQAEAVAHLHSTLRLDPSREAAWKRLGYKKQKDGRWMTDAQVARQKEEVELQKQADKQWRPLLEKWRSLLSDKDPAERAEAERGLAGVTDLRAVPMVWAIFATGDEARQKVAVQVLGQIDGANASRALAYLALASDSAEVRRVATETLRRRDPREYAGLLIALLHDPIKYEVRPVNGPGSTGTIFIEGERLNVQRRYNAPNMPYISIPYKPGDVYVSDVNGLPIVLRGGLRQGDYFQMAPDGTYAYGGFGFPGMIPIPQKAPAFVGQMIHDPSHAASILAANVGKGINPPYAAMMANASRMMFGRLLANNSDGGSGRTIMIGQAVLETQKAAANAQEQLMNDVAALDRFNAEVRESNERVVQVLKNATEQNLPPERKAWQRWLTDQFGFAQRVSDQQQKPTMVVDLNQSLPPLAGFNTNQNGYARFYSCFGAGTLVHTLTGTRPIETLRVGDAVLTQDIKTGALGYRPILVVHRNPPSKTFRIALGGETIVSSEFHRFWKAGKGWVMARDLKVGDTLRTLGGLVKVEAVETGAVQPVFNLDVDEDADFFVGNRGALVHDNTLPDLRLAPFDAEPSLAAATSH